MQCFDQVLFVAPHYKWWKGGISSVILEYKEAIPAFNFFASTSVANIYLTTLLFPLILLHFFVFLSVKRKIKIVHLHGASKGSFYRKYIFFLIAKYLFRKKVIYHIHGAKYHIFYRQSHLLIQRCIKHMINTSDALIVLSEWWKDFFLKEFHPQKIEIVPNIVGFRPLQETDKQAVNNKVTLLFLGRIGERKGIYDLLEVIAGEADFFRRHCQLLVGGDGEVNTLKKLIDQYKISDIVDYLGFVSGDQKKDILKSSDIYLLPSYNEGLPISILEALSYAKPIISTKVGGIPEIVCHGENGYLISPGDQPAMFQCLKELIQNPADRENMGRKSYEIVKEGYFPDKVLQKLNALYSSLI
jgi:glycosyltransferase involved in cell wall biosynthesis